MEGRNGNDINMGMKLNHNTIWKKGIKILARVGFGFCDINFLFPLLRLKSNPNTMTNEKWNGFSFSFSFPMNQKCPKRKGSNEEDKHSWKKLLEKYGHSIAKQWS